MCIRDRDYVLGKNLKSQLPSYADFEPLRYILMHMPTFPAVSYTHLERHGEIRKDTGIAIL